MTRPAFTEALEGVLGALREAAGVTTCGICCNGVYVCDDDNQGMAGDETCIGFEARKALARWDDRQRLRDDAKLTETLVAWGIDVLQRRGGSASAVLDAIDNHLAGGTAGTTATKEGS